MYAALGKITKDVWTKAEDMWSKLKKNTAKKTV